MRFSSVLRCALAVIAVACSFPSASLAQSVDVIRGRVIGEDSVPIAGARVQAVSLSGNVMRKALSDNNGRFTITFPNGDGDYMVTVQAIGFTMKRFEVKRTADQEILIADAKLSRAMTELEAVRVTPGERTRANRDDRQPDISGSERNVSAANVAAGDAGNIAAMASSLPGVTLVPGTSGDASGFSVLGLTPDQNATTLNGGSFGGADVPRDAGVSSSLSTSPYDVSRGGFSGAQFNIRSQSGNNFPTRTNSLIFDAPFLQWTDKAARAIGQEYTKVSLGGLLSGPIKIDEAFYNVSYQLDRKANDVQTLLNTSSTGLVTSGISPDSASRLLNILRAKGIPLSPRGTLSNRYTDIGSLLATLNIAPMGSRTGAAYALTFNGSANRSAPVGGSIGELPGHSGERTGYNGGVQGRHSAYFESGLLSGILSETNITLNGSHSEGNPYYDMPSGTVRVNSALPDGSMGVRSVQFGGSNFLNNATDNSSIGGINTLSWFSKNNKHRLKLTTELRRDAFTQDQTTNQLGSFSYLSLADLEAGRAASYSRQLSPRVRSGAQTVGAIALGDAWRKSNDLQIQYGVRVDGNAFSAGPTENPEIERLFGARNSATPNHVYVSPRLGFAWQYGEGAQIPGFEGAIRGPRAVVRGGVGVFQNVPQSTLLGPALDNTGLSSGVQQLTCVGGTVPAQSWSSWATSQASIPATCADGSVTSPFTNVAPNVTFFSKEWQSTRSVRGNLQWNGPVAKGRFTATVDLTVSSNLNQPANYDLNFAGVPKFNLPSEGGRPVFVPVTSIDPMTGLSAPRSSRLRPEFNAVNESRSDLRSESTQLSLRLMPMTFSSKLGWNLAYVYGDVREQYRGFQSTAGDPRAVAWGRSAAASKHQVQYSLNYNFFDAVRVYWNGNVRAGWYYTPGVSGDLNGDGLYNDRAFIPNPSSTADPALASAMQSLLASSTGGAKKCLESQLGRVADRNSCQGPWTHSAFLSVSFNPIRLHLPQRANIQFQVSNPIGAADLLVNGENNLKGWGQTIQPEATLLYVRGFNPATQRFTYEVNQRFGSTKPSQTTIRQPVTVTALMRVDLGPARERTLLTQQLDRGRRLAGQKASESMLNAMYGAGGVTINPMAMILRQTDSLHLTSAQGDSLATINRAYLITLNRLWAPVIKELAGLSDNFSHDEAYAQYRKTREASVDELLKIAPRVKNILTKEQQRKLPALVAAHLDPWYLQSIRTATVGGTSGGPFMFMGGGGGGPGVQSIMIRR
ncbi:MAG: TonB-dependent receptor [Gemmatimonadetes bacterium]|nr:TonB-dependent receptor [Gemmatimonadota bacterium]